MSGFSCSRHGSYIERIEHHNLNLYIHLKTLTRRVIYFSKSE
ncbi:IS1 family transposase [Plesiomonas shigelloides]